MIPRPTTLAAHFWGLLNALYLLDIHVFRLNYHQSLLAIAHVATYLSKWLSVV